MCLLAIWISSLEKNVYLDLLATFWLGCLFFGCWVIWAVRIFWKLSPCHAPDSWCTFSGQHSGNLVVVPTHLWAKSLLRSANSETPLLIRPASHSEWRNQLIQSILSCSVLKHLTQSSEALAYLWKQWQEGEKFQVSKGLHIVKMFVLLPIWKFTANPAHSFFTVHPTLILPSASQT